MWCFRRVCQSSPYLIVLSLIVAGGVLFHLRTLYDNHQKYLRIEIYNKDVEKLTDDMHSIQKLANTSLKLIRKLESYANDDAHRAVHKVS